MLISARHYFALASFDYLIAFLRLLPSLLAF